MTVNVYRCRPCGMMFRGCGLNYCPFCGGKLEQIGWVVGSKSLEDYIKNREPKRRWKLILFKFEDK